MHDDWVGTISSGVTWIVAHNAEDVYGITDAALQKVGDRSYRWAADWILSAGGFFGDTDISLEMTSQVTTNNFDAHWKCNPDSIVQFGLLWGGEANDATEVTNGCHISYQNLSGVLNCNMYNRDNIRDSDGAVINYYGCLINSEHADEDLGGNNWMFQRMHGPTRFIGCIQDGTMGGRFYHEASEWVNSTVAGNINLVPAFSMGATFTRAVENLRFGQNLVAFKTFNNFSGTFRDCDFSDSNTDVIFADASSGSSVVNLIDCTTVEDADIVDSGVGTIAQFKSVNYTMTDDSGAALSGVALRVNDRDDTTQSSVEVSSGSGVCGEILARFREWVTNPPSTVYSPFRIRIRQFGKQWTSLNSAIDAPIQQSFALRDDGNVTESSGVAQAHTGITLTDHGGSPVTWQGKSWGITVTCNVTSNPSLTADNVRHYLHYHLAQSASFNGKSSGLDWHNLIPMSGYETENGDYGGTTKGVRVVDESGNPFPGITRMQADDDTYYVPPVTFTNTITNIPTGAEVRIYDTDANADSIGTNRAGIESLTGTSFGFTSDGSESGTIVNVQIIKEGDFVELVFPLTLAANDQSIDVSSQLVAETNGV